MAKVMVMGADWSGWVEEPTSGNQWFVLTYKGCRESDVELKRTFRHMDEIDEFMAVLDFKFDQPLPYDGTIDERRELNRERKAENAD